MPALQVNLENQTLVNKRQHINKQCLVQQSIPGLNRIFEAWLTPWVGRYELVSFQHPHTICGSAVGQTAIGMFLFRAVPSMVMKPLYVSQCRHNVSDGLGVFCVFLTHFCADFLAVWVTAAAEVLAEPSSSPAPWPSVLGGDDSLWDCTITLELNPDRKIQDH